MSQPVIEEPQPVPPSAFIARYITANLWRVPPWSPRRAGTIALAQSADAHIWGLQESVEYERDLMPNLGGSWLEASDRSNLTLLYRSDLFRRIWHGEYSVPADDRSRHHVMAILEHLETGVKALIVNTHFSNGGAWAAVRTRHAQAIATQINAQKQAGRIDDTTPVIVMGDINDRRRASTADSPAAVFASIGLWELTLNGIDRVFARNATLTGPVQTIHTTGTPDPSDHNWISVDLTVGVGTPLPPPPPVKPPPVIKPAIVTMWVRPKGDPIYKTSADMHPRKPDGVTIDKSVTRYPGFRVTGRPVTVNGIKFIQVQSKRLYNVAYLTTERPK